MSWSEERRREGALRRLLRVTGQLVGGLLLLLIGAYRKAVSPTLRPRCRFLPTCSEYAELAVKRHGPLKGLGKAVWRLARCQPLCKGGYDEP